jgi:hypothetical protein
MRHPPSSLLAVTLLAVVACESPRDVRQLSVGQRAAAPFESTPGRQRLRDLSMRVSFETVELSTRLEGRFELPEQRAARHCPDDALTLDAPSGQSAVLTFGISDARSNGKTLLPSAFTEALRSSELASVAEHYRMGTADPTQAFHWLKSETDGAQALQQLARLRARRYRAIAHVIDYRDAALIYSLRRNRREWTPGTATAWIAIHDVVSRQALCQTLVSVRNETDGVSVRRRTRETVRADLVAALGAALRRETLRAVERLSGVLRPSADYSAAAAQTSQAGQSGAASDRAGTGQSGAASDRAGTGQSGAASDRAGAAEERTDGRLALDAPRGL